MNVALPLTPKQRESLEFIKQYIEARGYAPTAQEMANHFGIARNAAVGRLDQLFQKRHIVLYERMPRGISLP